MKLNPFRKSTSAYLDTLNADFAKAIQEAKATEHELATAREDHALKQEASRSLEAHHPQRQQLTNTEFIARRIAEDAGQRVRELEHRLRDLQWRIEILRHRVEAPERLATAKQTVSDLIRQRQSLQAEHDQTQALIARIDRRSQDLAERIRVETQAAGAALIGDEAFELPEALLRLDTELRVAQATRTNLQARVEAITAELDAIPAAVRDARQAFIHARAEVSEIELKGRLPEFIELIARAAASRHECQLAHSDDRYEIEIDHDVLSTVKARLAAEIPAG